MIENIKSKLKNLGWLYALTRIKKTFDIYVRILESMAGLVLKYTLWHCRIVRAFWKCTEETQERLWLMDGLEHPQTM